MYQYIYMNVPVHFFIPVCYSVLCYCEKEVEGIQVNKLGPDKGTFARMLTAEVDVYERAWHGKEGFLNFK